MQLDGTQNSENWFMTTGPASPGGPNLPQTLMSGYYANRNNAFNTVGPYPVSYLNWFGWGKGPWVVRNVPVQWMNDRARALFAAYPHTMIEDNFLLAGRNEVVEHLMTIFKPDVATPGEIRLDAKGPAMVIRYNPDLLEASYEKKAMTEPEDRAIVERWGEDIYRIRLRSRQPMDSGLISLEIAGNQGK